jgi:hypothetical protein
MRTHHSQDTIRAIRVNFLSVCMASSESSLVTARLLTIRLQDSEGPPCMQERARAGHIPAPNLPFSRLSRQENLQKEHNLCQVAGVILQGTLGLMLFYRILSKG